MGFRRRAPCNGWHEEIERIDIAYLRSASTRVRPMRRVPQTGTEQVATHIDIAISNLVGVQSTRANPQTQKTIKQKNHCMQLKPNSAN